MSKERFVIKGKDTLGLMTDATVIVDRETGVNYLFVQRGSASGLTPILDAEGKPIVSEVESKTKDGYQK